MNEAFYFGLIPYGVGVMCWVPGALGVEEFGCAGNCLVLFGIAWMLAMLVTGLVTLAVIWLPMLIATAVGVLFGFLVSMGG